MPSPNVGKVSVEADIKLNQVDLEKVRQALTDKLWKGAEPRLQKVNDKISGIADEINRVAKADLSRFANQVDLVEKPTQRFLNTMRKLTEQQEELKKVEEKIVAVRQRATESLAKEEAATQSLTEAEKRLKRLRNPNSIAEQNELIKERTKLQKEAARESQQAVAEQTKLEKRYSALRESIRDKEAKREDEHVRSMDRQNRLLEKARQDAIRGLKQQAAEELKSANEFIREETKKTNAVIAENKKRQREAERTQRAADRNAERERKRADREVERARVNAKNQAKRPFDIGGEITRSLTGLSLGVSPEALAVMATATIGLVGAIGSLSKAMLLIPTAGGAVFATMKTLSLGTQGFGDAIGALMSRNLDQFDHFLSELSPNAQQAALAIQQLLPQLEDFRKSIQDRLFANFPQMIQALTSSYLPLLSQGLGAIATQMNQFASNFAQALLQPEVMANIDTLLANTAEMFRQMAPAIQPFVQAITELMAVGSTLLPQFGANFTKMIGEFAKWVQVNSDNGKIIEWIKDGIKTLGILVKLAYHFGEAIAALAPVGERVLPVIVGMLEVIATILEEIPWLVEAIALVFIGGKLVKGVFNFAENVKKIGGIFAFLIPQGVRSGLAAMAVYLAAFTAGALAKFAAAVKAAFLPFTMAAAAVGAAGWLGNKLSEATARAFGREDSWQWGNFLTGEPLLSRQPLPEFAPTQPVQIDPQNAPAINNLLENLTAAPGDNRQGLRDALSEVPTPQNPVPVQEIENPYTLPTDMGLVAVPQAGVPAPDTPGFIAPPDFNAPQYTLTTPDAAGNGPWGPWTPLPVPPDTRDERGNKIPKPKEPKDPKELTANDLLDQVRLGGAPVEIKPFDPFESMGGVQNSPGWPGRPDLNVNVTNMPTTPQVAGLPMASGLPMAGVPVAVPPINLATIPDANGAKAPLDLIGALATAYGLQVTPQGGLYGREWETKSHHSTGNAVDVSNGSDSTPQMRALAGMLYHNFGPYLEELIYNDDMGGFGIKKGQPVDANSYYGATAHRNHVHVAIKDEMFGPFMAAVQGMAVPKSMKDNLYAQNTPLMQDPTLGTYGYNQIDNEAVMRATDDLISLGNKVNELQQEIGLLNEAMKLAVKGSEAEIDLRDKLNDKMADLEEIMRPTGELAQKQARLREAQTGKWNELDVDYPDPKQMSLDDLPFGHPMKILGGLIMGAGGTQADVQGLMGGFLGNAVAGLADGLFPQQMTPSAPSTSAPTLLQQRNPMALPAMAGLNVPDFTRQGGGVSAQNVMQNGQTMTANGQIMSNTAALIDRTLSNMDLADRARHEQVMSVLNQIAKRLGGEVLGPTLESGVSAGIGGISNEVTNQIGTALGNSAGPIIGEAVASKLGSTSTNPAAGAVNNGIGGVVSAAAGVIGVGGFASGGGITGPGTGTSDSILARVSHGEWVMTARQVQAMGGFAGMQAFVNSLPRYATGGGVDVTSAVGAEFFGVSQVPILGAIINVLIGVLLKVIGVNIEARDTLNEISQDFRSFRGEFQAFDAAGRLRNDTSALLDRTTSSAQTAADERIRILRLVLDALVKYIIEKVIVPIGKAVGNALLQAGAGALEGGLGAAFPGGSIVGGIAGSALTAGGSAAIDIIAEVWGEIGKSVFSVVFQAVGEGLQSYLPGATTDLFGGAGLARLFDPLTLGFSTILGGFASVLAGMTDALSGLFPGLKFDSGGVARGTGMMPKATLKPERVLSPAQTASFDRLVDALTSGRVGMGSTTTIHAPFTVTGDERGGRVVHNRLLALMS